MKRLIQKNLQLGKKISAYNDYESWRYDESWLDDGNWSALGEEDSEYEWDWVGDFEEGLAMVAKNEKFGFVNKDGELAVPCEWDYAWNFIDGLSIVEKNGKYGWINKSGELVIPCEWDDAWSFSEGLARVEKDGKWGFINKSGQLVIPLQWDEAWAFSEGLARVMEDGYYCYINKSGEQVIPLLFNDDFDYIIINNKEYKVIGNVKDSISIQITEDHRIESHFPHNNSDSATLFYNDEVVLTDNLEAIVAEAEFLGFSH